MNVLIFGSQGQDGFFLKELLRQKNIEVHGVSRSHSEILGDVSDYAFVDATIKKHQPDFIFHFAANSTARHDALFDNHKAISTGTINILESVRLHTPKTKVFLSGSALQFQNDNQPIDEETPFSANSAYSVARIHSVYAGRYFRDIHGLKVYVGYFFNHDSPLRTEKHVNQKITAAVRRIAKGSSEKLQLGNIDVQKEFNFAGDVVDAVWQLVNQNSIFEAVIGSGHSYSIKDWVTYCFQQIGKNWQDYVILKDNYTAEYQVLVSNPKRIKSIGWQPKVTFEQLADMMLAES